MSISGTMGIPSLAKGMLNDAKRYANRDVGQELIKVAQDGLNKKSENKCSKKLPTIQYLNDLEQDVKLINSHMSATNKLAKQYESLLKNSRNLERTNQNIEEQVVINTLRQARNSCDLLGNGDAIPIKITSSSHPNAKNASPIGGNISYQLEQSNQSKNNHSSAPTKQHVNFDLEIRAKPADKIASGKNIFQDTQQADMFKIVPLDYITSS